MAKRTSDADGVVRQLRPDDSGWLAELRRARTDKIDLAGDADEQRARWADELTLNGSAPDAASQEDSADHPSPWAPPKDDSSEPPVPISPPLPPVPLSAPPISPRPIPVPPVSPVPLPVPMPPVSPAPALSAQRPVWTLAVPEPPQWTLPLPERPLSPPPVLSATAAPVLEPPVARFPQPPPPARWLPDPVPEALQLARRSIEDYHDITPEPYDDSSPVPRSLRREDRPRDPRRSGLPRVAILLPLATLVAGPSSGWRTAAPAARPSHQRRRRAGRRWRSSRPASPTAAAP